MNTALSVIEEALKAAAYTDDFAPDYAKREAPAVLQRVLAAMSSGISDDEWLDAMYAFDNAVPAHQRGHAEWCERMKAAMLILAFHPTSAGEAIAAVIVEADTTNQYGKNARLAFAGDACMDLPIGTHELFTHPAPPIDLAAVRAVAEIAPADVPFAWKDSERTMCAYAAGYNAALRKIKEGK